MSITKETEKVNFKVAQWKQILDRNLLKNRYNKSFILQKINDINCRTVATDYLQSHHPNWIGNTPLHFAVESMDFEALNILLDHGADFTVKNSSNSTVLHQFLEQDPNSLSESLNPDGNFINSVIAAHLKYNNFENPLNENGLSHFHIACAVNNVEVVKKFLQNGVAIDHAVKTECSLFPGFTPLHFAANNCAFEVAEVLLTHNADIQIKDARGMIPLHVALERKLKIISQINSDEKLMDRADKLFELLYEKESKDDVMIRDSWGLSHFHVACALKDSKTAACLLPKVVDINQTVNVDSPLWPGYTPLHFAVLCNMNTVKLLMTHGADIMTKDAKGVTPFDMCIKRGKAEDIFTIISLHPTWNNIMLSDGTTKLTDALFAMSDINQFNLSLRQLTKKIFDKNICIDNLSLWSGYTPMHLAVLFAEERVIENWISPAEKLDSLHLHILVNFCCENPSMLFHQDRHGQTPLHLAFLLNKKPVLDLIFNFLDSTDYTDEDGLSFLHIAAAENNVPLLKKILSVDDRVYVHYKGTSLVSRMLYPGSTALHFAVVNGSTEALETLMNSSADVYAKDANDMTPIHLLSLTKDAKLADVLLKTPNLKDSVVRDIGLSHLHVACVCGKPEHVEILLHNGADVNGVVTYRPKEGSSELQFLEKYAGRSPLLLAFENDNYEIVKLLLKRGADFFVKNAEGKALLYSVLEFNSKSLNDFVDALKKNEDLKARVKADTEMTALHVACLFCEVEIIKKLISEGANVNTQIHSGSLIFRGCTPLHIFLWFGQRCDDVVSGELIKLFVKAGVDVTLQNGYSETVVHMADKVFDEFGGKRNHDHLNTLLEAQRDFSVNPVSGDGVSHFQLACYACNPRVVEEFFSHGDIDVNQPIDYFHVGLGGESVLHLAAIGQVEFCGVSNVLSTVDLLINHGADIHAENNKADTPLHKCCRHGFLDVFERLARAGTDVNAMNAFGHTPLYNYLKSDGAVQVMEEIKVLLRFGCHLNVFDAVTEVGHLGQIVEVFSYEDAKNLLSALVINFRSELEIDNLGRSAIHNMVTVNPQEISTIQYAALIEKLSIIDCNVDRQDHLGRTALHMATKFYNFDGISGLLMAGADINITDISGKTALAYNFDCTCAQSELHAENPNEPDDEESEIPCKHIDAFCSLAIHVEKLQLYGLDVDKQNGDLMHKAFGLWMDETQSNEDFLQEMNTVKAVRIEPHALTLQEFYSELGAVADYPTMSAMKREDINKFFSTENMTSFREKFPMVAGILQLQYRKARARPQLVESAKNAMTSLIGFRLPEICSHFILIFLKNSELKSLIASAA